jgi:c-di-AMP phosphodiesterase-like protein
LFRDDFSTILNRAEVVSTAKILYDKIAIGRLEKGSDDALLIAAQAANELLNINDVEASFVLTNSNEKVHISGRSLGSISVQLILEKLGGGGHLTSAGTQIYGKTVDEVEKLLIEQIDKYLEDGEED